MRRQGYQRKGTRGSGQSGRIRIIAGRLGGRRIQVAALNGLRPTPERTRETLFNWLQAQVVGARVLDPFAGSGALGLEAWSRGARHVVMIEQSARAHAQLQKTCAELAVDNCELVRADALRWLAQARQQFDLVLLDPPFGRGLAGTSLTLVCDQGLLAPGARIYCEIGTQETPPWAALPSLVLERETLAGDSRAVLLRHAPGQSI